MKFLLFAILLNFAYAQTDQAKTETSETDEVQTKASGAQKQEPSPEKGVKNPFKVGPYEGEDYQYIDKEEREKEEEEKNAEGLI